MIAARFKSIAWVAGVATAALGCYLVSQSVAAERAGLARVDRQIADTRQDIDRLTMEIGTRARMSQLEHWNTEVLALQAPAPQQFLQSEVQLASLQGGHSLPLDPAVMASKGAVTTVSYSAPAAAPAAAPAPAPASAPLDVASRPLPDQPLLRSATYVKIRPDRLSADAPAPVAKVAMIDEADDAPAAPVAPAAHPHHAKPQKAASLLPDDIDSLVSAERAAHKAHTRPAAR